MMILKTEKDLKSELSELKELNSKLELFKK